MPQVPLPHILRASNGYLKIVAKELKNGFVVDIPKNHQDKIGNVIVLHDVYEFTEVTVERPAKGDWSEWEFHPKYFEGKGRLVGRKSKEELKKMKL